MDEEEAKSRLRAEIACAIECSESKLTEALRPSVEQVVGVLLPIWRAEQETARTPGRIGALLPFRYVIPDQDLKLLDTVFSVLTASAAAGYFFPQLGFDPAKGVAAAVTAVAVAVFKMLHSLRLAIHLEEPDHAIVVALAGAGRQGLSVPSLLKVLQPIHPNLTSAKVKRRLETLTACSNLSGTKSTLVWRDAHELWHANGI
jgi:hypothetical protein